MRALLLLALLPTVALAQGRPNQGGGGTACALASGTSAFASYFRATTTTNTVPGYQCDGVLDKCVKLGPGQDTGVGVNTLGEVVFGRSGQTTGVWRFWGTAYANTFNATNVTATNVATINIYQQTTAGYLDNPNGTQPLLFNDTQGYRFTCKTALTTCAVGNEGTIFPICGTGGALTKQCMCTGDGTTYAWRNLLNPTAGAGTTTTCPAT